MNTCPNCEVPGGVTVMAAVPLCPSLVAVIIAVPATWPVTSPVALTVATLVLLEAHVTVRPVSGLPVASLGVAVSCSVEPTGTVAELGVTLTDATGTCTTVTVDVPLCPSLVAVMVAVPATLPVTSPLALTVATPVLREAQVTVRAESTLPLESRGVAVSCTVCPSNTWAVAGVTDTDATGTPAAVTVMAAVPLCPSLVAVIAAVPATLPVTNPLALTVATVVLLEAHVTTRPGSGLPLTSRGVATSCTVAPTGSDAGAGVTASEATGAGGAPPSVLKLKTG